MRKNRLYINDSLETGLSIDLDKQRSHYLLNVLRLKEQDSVIVFNGTGNQAQAQITNTGKQRVALEIVRDTERQTQSQLYLHLIQGLSRGDRMDFTVQKAVELGISEITPIYTEHSNIKLDAKRTERKVTHWQKVAISACEQCGQNYLPKINYPTRLGDILTSDNATLTRVVMDVHAAETINSITLHDQAVTFLAGPEGGLSDSEIQLLNSRGYTSIKLGPRVLRTETAAIALISAAQTLWGDFR